MNDVNEAAIVIFSITNPWASFDLNGDGVINVKATIYSELKIWQDKNQNGVADERELLSLKEAGIAGIGLD